MRVQFIAVSQNAKTGPIPVSIVERASCWAGCALYENGCYAETGALAMHRWSGDAAAHAYSLDKAMKMYGRIRTLDQVAAMLRD